MHSGVLNKMIELGAPSSSKHPSDNREENDVENSEDENSEKQRQMQPQRHISNINRNRMNESIGHTKLQVFVGALLGFLVSIAVHHFS